MIITSFAPQKPEPLPNITTALKVKIPVCILRHTDLFGWRGGERWRGGRLYAGIKAGTGTRNCGGDRDGSRSGTGDRSRAGTGAKTRTPGGRRQVGRCNAWPITRRGSHRRTSQFWYPLAGRRQHVLLPDGIPRHRANLLVHGIESLPRVDDARHVDLRPFPLTAIPHTAELLTSTRKRHLSEFVLHRKVGIFHIVVKRKVPVGHGVREVKVVFFFKLVIFVSGGLARQLWEMLSIAKEEE